MLMTQNNEVSATVAKFDVDFVPFDFSGELIESYTAEEIRAVHNNQFLGHIKRLFYCWGKSAVYGEEELYCINKVHYDSSFRESYQRIVDEYKKFKLSGVSDIDTYVDNHILFSYSGEIVEKIDTPPSVVVESIAKDEITTQDFKLPNYFFKNESVNMENTYIKSYANLNPDIRIGGVEKFEELINYLAATGCIDDSREAKESFVFKFTGKKVSESTNTANHQIKWGRKRDDLVYLVQNILLITNPKNKYESLNEHFVFEDNKLMPKVASNLAANAHKGFVAGVKSIYPEVEK